MAHQIIRNPPASIRVAVKYLSAAGESGKTSSVLLPAFLESTSMDDGGTNYLYLAFDNNNERKFTAVPALGMLTL
jgi:hypothetical protein